MTTTTAPSGTRRQHPEQQAMQEMKKGKSCFVSKKRCSLFFLGGGKLHLRNWRRFLSPGVHAQEEHGASRLWRKKRWAPPPKSFPQMRIIGLNAREKEIRLTLPRFHAQVPFPHEETMTKREGCFCFSSVKESNFCRLFPETDY